MLIGVGSGNPVKRAATERAVAATDGYGAGATVEAVPVPSGVAEQPRGTRETRAGAVNRAEAVLAADRDGIEAGGEADADAGAGYDLGVGIEGGVAEFDGSDDLFLVMWAAATDGDRLGVGAGPSLALPEAIAGRVRDGEELGPVMDDVLGESGVARNQGAAGALTGGGVDRTEALATAVSAALGPFVTELYG
ncbi:DUF84 domain-containing protein [Halobacteriales archaeon QS_6_71_20]|nr:MAG: DUF84 domain-containing protein [Halobacteriales archaeon QS_6_71_20]